MYIRSLSWGEPSLSWSHVIAELLHSAEEMGHTAHFLSTNGTCGLLNWTEERHLADVEAERQMRALKRCYDLDCTFTVPVNFPQRFLPNSKVKMAIYDYESSAMDKKWTQYYKLVDFVLPASHYVADMFARNGCPKEKIQVVHHGIDLNRFNPTVSPLKLPTEKKFKFLCVAAPHYRKQLDKLLDVYARTFTAKDDVSLILKTKIFKDGEELKGFEMDLRPKLMELRKRYGANLPEIKILTARIANIASLYTACDAFALMTASEGWGIPFLEAMACGLTVIAPRHGGQLDFLNDSNSILCDTGTRLARVQEQYWGATPGAIVGNPDENHFSFLMKDVYIRNAELKQRLNLSMQQTVSQFTWQSAMQKILDLAQSTGRILE